MVKIQLSNQDLLARTFFFSPESEYLFTGDMSNDIHSSGEVLLMSSTITYVFSPDTR